ncbi:hypothetical protein D3C85_699070 [compost metagenome]
MSERNFKPVYSADDEERLIKEWQESGMGVTNWCSVITSPPRPSYGSMNKWIKARGLSKPKAASTAPASKLQNLPIVVSLSDAETAYKQNVQSVIDSLEAREKTLTAELDEVMSELVKAREKLTKFD